MIHLPKYLITPFCIQITANRKYRQMLLVCFAANFSIFFLQLTELLFCQELTGATGQRQTIHRMFSTKPFAARYVEFRPTQINSGGNDACVRFELYGCSYGIYLSLLSFIACFVNFVCFYCAALHKLCSTKTFCEVLKKDLRTLCHKSIRTGRYILSVPIGD